MARNRASMREGPLAELFRATEAAQRQASRRARTGRGAAEPLPKSQAGGKKAKATPPAAVPRRSRRR